MRGLVQRRVEVMVLCVYAVEKVINENGIRMIVLSFLPVMYRKLLFPS